MSVFRRIQVGEFIFESAADGVVAAGTTQATAFQLGNFELNRLTTVSAGAGVMLPPSQPGMTLVIVNHGANPVQVYGQPGDTVDDVATASGVGQMVDSWVIYTCFSAGAWYTEGLASGYARSVAGQFSTFSVQTGITASTTHTQAGGVPITAMNVQVSVAAGAGDAVTLPVAKPGMEITIVNNGASAIQVYGSATDSATINGTAGATGVAQAAAAVTIYYAFVAGAWVTK